jgi:hypothetical protein
MTTTIIILIALVLVLDYVMPRERRVQPDTPPEPTPTKARDEWKDMATRNAANIERILRAKRTWEEARGRRAVRMIIHPADVAAFLYDARTYGPIHGPDGNIHLYGVTWFENAAVPQGEPRFEA